MAFRIHLLLASVAMFLAATAEAQQVTIGTPFTTARNSFNEQFGTNFGFNLKGGRPRGDDRGRSSVVGFGPGGAIQFQQGGGFGANPAFGGFNQGNRSTGGFSINNNGNSFNFGFSGVQANNQTLISQTPTVTTFNGQPAMFSDQVQQPFVISVTPIVGNGIPNNIFSPGFRQPRLVTPPASSPLLQRLERLRQGEGQVPAQVSNRNARRVPAARGNERLRRDDSSAVDGALSVAEIRRRQGALDNVDNQIAMENYRRGLEAQQSGKNGIAKIFYRMATRDAVGPLKDLARKRLEQVSSSSP